MSKNNFQVDGIGINTDLAGLTEAKFLEEILPGLPDRFGTPEQKATWSKKAYGILQEKTKPAEVKSAKK
jgi:hypothetical protein